MSASFELFVKELEQRRSSCHIHREENVYSVLGVNKCLCGRVKHTRLSDWHYSVIRQSARHPDVAGLANLDITHCTLSIVSTHTVFHN